ncbi:hypothetical protein [Chitinophaga eiseniae]|uniref:Uncharacterized protein n=1 Tax=Chitinophaga eiseniae TaxID=634771 RepID=A0A847SGX2_9BACT|nr:hypothetical protein [Chitinophaga eiseniae]NLR78047.1 hypothetical protein [Chitinophaga eiseniae]
MYFTSLLHLAHDGDYVSITITLLNAKSSKCYEHLNIMESKKWYILDPLRVPNLVNSFQLVKVIKVPVYFNFQVISDHDFSVELLSTLIDRFQRPGTTDNLAELYGGIVLNINSNAKVVLSTRQVNAEQLTLLEAELKSECSKFKIQPTPDI